MRARALTAILLLGGCGSMTPASAPTASDGARQQRLSAGAGHTCAIGRDGFVYCWGSNPDGQLGDGTQVSRAQPARVQGVSDAVSVAAGSYHVCALVADGGVRCWGWNVGGQIGEGTTTNHLTAIPVQGIGTAIAIAAGSYHSCALLVDGSAQCWGQNDLGQLGDGARVDRARPVAVFSLPPAIAITAGGRHTCALIADGTIQCWGGNDSGELGDGTVAPHEFPTPVPGIAMASAVAAGFQHTCALLADGHTACWGANGNGQLGNGTPDDTVHTADVVLDLPAAASIAAGYFQTCAVSAAGSASCWGWNASGQLGDGTQISRAVPEAITALPAADLPAAGLAAADSGGLSSVVEIAGGGFHSCARLTGGEITCFGANESGQLGIEDHATHLAPTALLRLGD